MIVFKSLTKDEVRQITAGMLRELSERCLNADIVLRFCDAAVEQLSSIGFDSVYGARPLRRAIAHNIEDVLAEKFLKGELCAKNTCVIDYADNSFSFVVD